MALLPKTPPKTQQPSELVRIAQIQELAEQLTTAQSHCDTLTADLAEARVVADSAHRLRMMAEDAWELNGGNDGNHTVQEAQRLEQRRAEDATATQRVADLERQVSDLEGEIMVLRQSDERVRALALVEELWPPTVRALVKPVRDLIPALKAQHAAWERLAEERASGNVDRALELAIYGAGFSDDLLTELERWLAAVERSGLADGKAK